MIYCVFRGEEPSACCLSVKCVQPLDHSFLRASGQLVPAILNDVFHWQLTLLRRKLYPEVPARRLRSHKQYPLPCGYHVTSLRQEERSLATARPCRHDRNIERRYWA